jgi:hypothetical protein
MHIESKRKKQNTECYAGQYHIPYLVPDTLPHA